MVSLQPVVRRGRTSGRFGLSDLSGLSGRLVYPYVGPSVHPLVSPLVRTSVHLSVRWSLVSLSVSDDLVMLLLFGATYGRASRLVFTKVSRQFLGSGPREDNDLWYHHIPGRLQGGLFIIGINA